MAGRILVVDDDSSQRETLCDLLRFNGHCVQPARDGREAEKLIKLDPPDVILLDINLPYKDGISVCRQIKSSEETRLIPVVLMTGLSETIDRVIGIEAGADDFLNKPFDPVELLVRVSSLLKRKEYTDELDHAEHVIMALGRSVEAKDPYTDGHCARISEYSVLLGKALRLDSGGLRALRISGSIHDIGKVGVPDAILLKRGPLDSEELGILRSHTTVGERICQPLRSLHAVLPIIRNHHEKRDGSGYPDGLSGGSIPLLARIMQIADVFDALTTERSDRRAFTREEALEQMNREVRIGWWDPDFFGIFAELACREGFPENFRCVDAIA